MAAKDKISIGKWLDLWRMKKAKEKKQASRQARNDKRTGRNISDEEILGLMYMYMLKKYLMEDIKVVHITDGWCNPLLRVELLDIEHDRSTQYTN